MSSTIFLIIALVTTGIFVIQFVLSIFFGDIDADVDVDADISSVVSFKGLTHFGIGFGWYMYLAGNTEIQSYVIGILVGLFFVLAVWFLYKKAYQLQQVNHNERSEEHTSELQSPLNLVCRLLLEKNFFNDTATTEIYTLSLHDALPI